MCAFSRRKAKTMEIEIPTMTNNNGPISAVYVVVIYVDSEISQSFDEHLLTHYKQAQEDGSSYYIAAELTYEVNMGLDGDCMYYQDLQIHGLCDCLFGFSLLFIEPNTTIHSWRWSDVLRIFQRSLANRSSRACFAWYCKQSGRIDESSIRKCYVS